MLAIPLITLQAVVEVAIGGFIALFITDLTRQVTRGFLASTGGVLVLIGGLGLLGQVYLPDPSHLTDHPLSLSWLHTSLRYTAVFLATFVLYLVAVYLRPAALHVILGILATVGGVATLLAAAFTYPTPGWGAAGSGVSFALSAVIVGTVTTAMLLGHWYLVVPNLSTRPLYILLGIVLGALVAQAALDAAALYLLAGHGTVAGRADILSGGYRVTFWMHVGAGIALPLAITAMTVQSTRLRSLMSATGLLYVAVVLTLVGQVTGKVIFFNGNLPL